ncbi:hypothetical protein EAE99_008315 [Botrytis elliptica]|nr:hypothetical protein EAE99_008315 [Botrytis elliptica]
MEEFNLSNYDLNNVNDVAKMEGLILQMMDNVRNDEISAEVLDEFTSFLHDEKVRDIAKTLIPETHIQSISSDPSMTMQKIVQALGAYKEHTEGEESHGGYQNKLLTARLGFSLVRMLYPLKELQEITPSQMQQLEVIIKGVETIMNPNISEESPNEMKHPEITQEDTAEWGGYSGSKFAITDFKNTRSILQQWGKEAGLPVSLGVVDTKRKQVYLIDSTTPSTIIWMQNSGEGKWNGFGRQRKGLGDSKGIKVDIHSHNSRNFYDITDQESIKEKFRILIADDDITLFTDYAQYLTVRADADEELKLLLGKWIQGEVMQPADIVNLTARHWFNDWLCNYKRRDASDMSAGDEIAAMEIPETQVTEASDSMHKHIGAASNYPKLSNVLNRTPKRKAKDVSSMSTTSSSRVGAAKTPRLQVDTRENSVGGGAEDSLPNAESGESKEIPESVNSQNTGELIDFTAPGPRLEIPDSEEALLEAKLLGHYQYSPIRFDY